MRLNCDLGEGFDEVDARVMPLIDMANIACGGHAGDLQRMQRCVTLAKTHNTLIGAHPSYPDRQNFGRKSPTNICVTKLTASLTEQLERLQSVCQAAQQAIQYVKPHGALYHDAATLPEVLESLLLAIRAVCPNAPLMLQASANGMPPPSWQALTTTIETVPTISTLTSEHLRTQPLWTEAFADRAYTPAGALLSREQPGAVLDSANAIFRQACRLITDQPVITTKGTELNINADSLCVHGDTPAAYDALEQIHQWRAKHQNAQEKAGHMEQVSETSFLLRINQDPSPDLTQRLLALSRFFKVHFAQALVDHVIAYNSILFSFTSEGTPVDLPAVERAWQAAQDVHFTERTMAQSDGKAHGVCHRIPVCYDSRLAPDIIHLARHTMLDIEEVIQRHCARIYHVYATGFLPGFAFLGFVDEAIAMPRHTTPRKTLAPGSVGIADRQTGIYPCSSPAGWQILGRTPLSLYPPPSSPQQTDNPSTDTHWQPILNIGDQVQFESITFEQFQSDVETSQTPKRFSLPSS